MLECWHRLYAKLLGEFVRNLHWTRVYGSRSSFFVSNLALTGSACLVALGLSGCAANYSSAPPVIVTGAAMQGNVHGGNQPVSGAKVYLYAAGSSGIGTASRSMLTGAGYVLTQPDGTFSISGDYTCQTGDQVYLLAVGGNPGLAPGTNNPLLTMMTALGSCGALRTSQFVSINEVTTVASEYALNGFMASPTLLSSNSTPLSVQGMTNAFKMVNVLVDTNTGLAKSQANGVPGTVPQAEINTLANAIAACVNSNGTGAGCTGLQSATGQAQPIDTLQAIIDIASLPYMNVAAVYGLSAANAPFQPTLTAAPNDWTLSVLFEGGGLSSAQGVAIDGFGNAWFANGDSNSVSELSPSGAAISPISGYVGGGLFSPTGIAVDSSNNIWVSNYGDTIFSHVASSVTELSNAGVPISPPLGYTAGPILKATGIALDGSGDAWVTSGQGGVVKLDNSGNALSPNGGYDSAVQFTGPSIDTTNNFWAGSYLGSTVTELTPTGVASNFAGGGISAPQASAIDSAGNVWLANQTSISKISHTGAALSPSAGYTGGGLSSPVAVALDGFGNVLVLNGNYQGNVSPTRSLSMFTGSGNAYSPSTGYKSQFFQYPTGVAVDGSGNVWVSDAGMGAVVFVGLAIPTYTPLALGVKLGKLATIP